jgi:hypothetical protein
MLNHGRANEMTPLSYEKEEGEGRLIPLQKTTATMRDKGGVVVVAAGKANEVR